MMASVERGRPKLPNTKSRKFSTPGEYALPSPRSQMTPHTPITVCSRVKRVSSLRVVTLTSVMRMAEVKAARKKPRKNRMAHSAPPAICRT